MVFSPRVLVVLLWVSFVSKLTSLSLESPLENKFISTVSSSPWTNHPRIRRNTYSAPTYYAAAAAPSYATGSSACNCPACSLPGGLIAFSLGAVLGMLVSAVPLTVALVTPAINSARSGSARERKGNSGFLSDFLHPDLNNMTIAMTDAFHRVRKNPGCAERWLCEVAASQAQNSSDAPLFGSLGIGWALSQFSSNFQFFQDFEKYSTSHPSDCKILSPNCKQPFFKNLSRGVIS